MTHVDKILKVEITCEAPDGRRYVKSIEGKTARQWEQFCTTVVLLAENHRMNPPWGEITWKEHEIS